MRLRMPFNLWLGWGHPINPYSYGLCVSILRRLVAPKCIDPLPSEFYMNSEDMDLLEYTQLREWMRQWLSYLSWYYRVAMSPTVTIEELLDALVISFRPWVNRTEEDLVRFGYAWKCIDLICRLRKVPNPVPIFGFPSTSFPGFLIGGGDRDHNFLEKSLGLNQPKAGGGVVVCGVTTVTIHSTQTILYKTCGNRGKPPRVTRA